MLKNYKILSINCKNISKMNIDPSGLFGNFYCYIFN